jgi:PPOX class probable F420-dependent enzyme
VKPPPGHIDLLERPLFGHLATVRADGAPQVNPMWFLWDPELEVLKFTHTKTRHNYRYLQGEPRVALSITDPNDQYRCGALLSRSRTIPREASTRSCSSATGAGPARSPIGM